MTHAATSVQRYPLPELTRVMKALFAATGMDADKARAVTHSLLSADSMGHGTHGLALAPWYVPLASGVVAALVPLAEAAGLAWPGATGL